MVVTHRRHRLRWTGQERSSRRLWSRGETHNRLGSVPFATHPPAARITRARRSGCASAGRCPNWVAATSGGGSRSSQPCPTSATRGVRDERIDAASAPRRACRGRADRGVPLAADRRDGTGGRRARRRAASVDLVCERAGMSRRTFYEHFTDGEQCFVSAVGQAFDQLFAAINAAVGTEAQDWEDRACTTVAALIATLDLTCCAPRVVSRKRQRRCVEHPPRGGAPLGAGARRRSDRGGRGPPRRCRTRGVGAIFELATDPILADEPLQSIVAPALYTALAPFTGRRTASRRAADPPRIASVSVVRAADVPLAPRPTGCWSPSSLGRPCCTSTGIPARGTRGRPCG